MIEQRKIRIFSDPVANTPFMFYDRQKHGKHQSYAKVILVI